MGVPHVAFPDTPTPHRLSSTEGDIVISVRADGLAFIGAKWFPPADLTTRLNQLAITTSDPNVLLRLDRSLSYRSVRRLLRILAEAGFSRVSFVTSEGYAGEDLPFTALPDGAA
jgi:biopolymer transport protein ExbD